MTWATCFKCGEIKFGAFCPCDKCGALPTSEEDLVISMAMTDHYLDLKTLEEIGNSIKTTGKPPDLDPQSKSQIIELVREIRPMLPSMEKMMGQVQTAAGRPWWKFW